MAQSVKYLFLLLLALTPLSASAADGASLSLSPAAGAYALAKTFTVNLMVSSPGQSLNAVSAHLSYPADKLEVVSVSETGSIVKVWTEEPVFQNGAGTIRFEGVVLNPGFQGESGKVIAITFRPKKIGQAEVQFVSASVLANDGAGTNILTGSFGGRYNLVAGSAPASPGPVAPEPTPPPSKTDTTPPETFTIRREPYNSTTAPQPIVSFSTRDTGSGIAGYQIKIDDKEWIDAATIKIGEDLYRLPAMEIGTHTLTARATDKAGNYTDASLTVDVDPIAAPQITAYTPKISPPEKPFTVQGENAPGNVVIVRLSSENKTIEVEAVPDESGKWAAEIAQVLPEDEYKLTVTARRNDGATSLPSSPLPVTVTSWSNEALGLITGYATVGGIILALLAVLFVTAILWRARAIRLKQQLAAETAAFEAQLGRDKARLAADLAQNPPPDKQIIERDLMDIEADTKAEAERLRALQ